MRVTDTLAAVRVWTSPSGKTLVDFGQNVVGWVRLHAQRRTAGAEVTVRHAEVLDARRAGDATRCAAREATDTYFLAGTDEEILEPSLHLPRVPLRRDHRARRYPTARPRSGRDRQRPAAHRLVRRRRMRCSTSFHENVVWGMRGNFVDVPTDCPQRDERLGWTGDIQVFSPTATYLLRHRRIPHLLAGRPRRRAGYVTAVYRTSSPTSCAPDDFRAPLRHGAMLRPWCPGCCGSGPATGRPRPAIRRACAHGSTMSRSVAGDDLIWRGGVQYGDWLDPTAPADDSFRAKADPDVVATAHFARSPRSSRDAAEVLDRRTTPHVTTAALAERVRAAFAAEFVDPRRSHRVRRSDRLRDRAGVGPAAGPAQRATLPASVSRTSCAQAVSGSPPDSSAHPASAMR